MSSYIVKRAWGKNTVGEWIPGGTHAIALARIERAHRTGTGSYVRERGDALCQQAAKFAKLEPLGPGEAAEVTCKKCLDHLARLGLAEAKTGEKLTVKLETGRKRKPSAEATVRLPTARLLGAVEQASQAIDNSLAKTTPILGCLYLTWSGKRLTVVGTDLETTWSVEVEVDEAGADGAVAVASKLLLPVLRSLAGSECTLEQRDVRLRLRATKGKSSAEVELLGLPLADMPALPSASQVEDWESIDPRKVASMLHATMAAASKDVARVNMNVIAIQGGKRDGLAAVATDGHRLVRTEAKFFGRPLQLPLRAASRLRKLAEGMDEEDELEVGFTLGTKDTRSYMFVRAGWVTLGINLAAVNYPATEHVIKGALDVSTTIEVATADLVAALRSSAAIDGRVRIELDDAGETITLAARSPDVGEGRFAVGVTIKGKGCRKVLISTSLLLELVEAAELGERLELQLTNALGPIVLRRPDAHSAYLGLLMPMREGSDG